MITITAYLEHCYSDPMNHRIKQLWITTPAYLYRWMGNTTLQKYAPVALTWTMIATFCWLLAYWTWVLITPAPQPAPVQTNTNNNSVMLEPLIDAHLFGVAAQPVASAVVQLSNLGLKLRGVFAGEGKTGVAAIINIDQKDKSFRIGDEITAGVVLTHVYPDYVELSYQGATERLTLERTTRTDGLIIPPPPPLGITSPQNTYTGRPSAQGVFP